MEIIYPEETRTLLAKYDKLMHTIKEDYEHAYPFPSEHSREIFGEEWYARTCYKAAHQRRTRTLADPIYQACIAEKAKIISLSPCTLLFDKSEWTAKEQP